ncbi:MAG: hypothetical protein BYD32DRAFT_218929 [Podila humilis]|nr:MAG: hypothetical protein BYD32DRAFT_218929 [Podila humilis]
MEDSSAADLTTINCKCRWSWFHSLIPHSLFHTTNFTPTTFPSTFTPQLARGLSTLSTLLFSPHTTPSCLKIRATTLPSHPSILSRPSPPMDSPPTASLPMASLPTVSLPTVSPSTPLRLRPKVTMPSPHPHLSLSSSRPLLSRTTTRMICALDGMLLNYHFETIILPYHHTLNNKACSKHALGHHWTLLDTRCCH